MTDPLSISASIVSLVVPALHGIRLLLKDIQDIKDAPETLRLLKDDLRSIDAALTSLQAVRDVDWQSLGGTIAEDAELTIRSCAKACDKLREDLQHWTKHSEDGKLAWTDRAKVGFFKQDRIKTTSEQLRNCKLAINSIVSLATLYSSFRHTHMTEELKESISDEKAEIRSAIDRTDRKVTDLESTLKDLKLLLTEKEEPTREAEDTGDEASNLQQIAEEQSLLKNTNVLLQRLLDNLAAQEEALKKASRPGQTGQTNITFGTLNSGFQVGASSGPISGISFGKK